MLITRSCFVCFTFYTLHICLALSQLKISKAERDVYAAVIDEKVAVKIGPGHYEPPHDSKRWNVAAEGVDYRVWEAS